MKAEIQLIIKYLVLMFKNWVLGIVLFLDLVGALITYFTDLNVPKWVFFSFPFIALLITGYKIFKNSSPEITIDKPLEEEFRIVFPYSNSYSSFEISFDTYIRNFGLQSGSLEDIKINFLGVNDIKDDFILRNMGFSFNKFMLSKEKNTFSFMPIDFKGEYSFKFPMVLPPDTIIPIYLRVNMSINDSSEMMEWIKTLQFEIEYKTRDGYGSGIKKVPFTLKVNNLFEMKEDAIKTEEKLDELW